MGRNEKVHTLNEWNEEGKDHRELTIEGIIIDRDCNGLAMLVIISRVRGKNKEKREREEGREGMKGEIME